MKQKIQKMKFTPVCLTEVCEYYTKSTHYHTNGEISHINYYYDEE